MDAKEKPSQSQNVYNFTGKPLPLRRTASKGDLHGNNTNHLTLSIDLKNKIQENNDRINLTINSSRSFNQTTRSFALPGLVNLANSDLRNKSDVQVFATSTPRDERSGMSQTKRSGFHTTSNQSKTRPNSPRAAKEELMTAKSQLNELRGIFANQTSTKFFSSTATTPSAATNRSKLDGDFQTLSQIEKRILARARFEKDRSESQSKLLKRRDISYIADAISRPSTPGKLKMDSCRESSILANENFGSPTSQMASIQGESPNPQKLKTRPILTSSLDRQQFSKLLKVRFEATNETEGQDTLDAGSPIASFDRRRAPPHTARNSEINSSDLGSLNAGFNEHISKNFNTGLLDKISATDYVMTSNERTPRHQRTSSMGSPEDMPMIPKLSNVLFGTPQRAYVKTEENELLAKCKKECPNLFSGVLAGRQDVLLLSSWLKDTLNEVNKSNSSENEKLTKCDEVYNICLNDLIRQVSLECVERGDFLYQVWMSYYKLLLQFKTNVAADNQKAKIQHKTELEDQKTDYLKIIAQKDQEIERLIRESKHFQEENLKLTTKNDKFLNKETKYKAKIDTLKDIISHMKTQIEELKAENHNYAKRFIKNPLLKENSKKRLSRSSSIQVEYAGDDAKVKVIFASKDAETDTNAEKVPQINLIVDSGTNLTVEDPTSKSPKTHNNIDDIDSDESIISEAEFVFLDTETNTKQKYTFSQLNSHLLAYRPSRISTKGELNPLKLMDVDKEDAGVQTHISLMDANFDSLFNAQVILDELLVEKKLKTEVDNFAETTEKILRELEAEQKNLEEKLLKKISFAELKTQLGNLNIPDALLDSLRYLTEKALAQGATPEFFAKIGDEIASPQFTHKSKLEVIDAILQGSTPSQQEVQVQIQAQSQSQETVIIRNTITTVPQVILEEEEKIKRELHPPPPPKSLKVIESDKTEVATKNSIPNSKTNRSPTLKRRTEEKGSVEKDLTLSRVVSAEKDLRISRVASAEKELKISRVESLSGAIASAGTGGSKVIDGQQEESMKVPKLVRRTEQTDQTQVNKAPEVLVTAPKTKIRKSLSITKIHSMGNLDMDQDFMPEAIADKKAVGSVNFSERSEHNYSPERADFDQMSAESFSARLARRSRRSSTVRLSVASNRPSKVNFLTPFGEPRRESQQQQQPTFDMDANLSGKVKLILLARMYKTEKEKAESYRMDIDDLKEKLEYTKKEEEKSEKKVSELLAKMKKLEKKAEKCIHQVCPICGEQNNAVEEEEEEEAPAAAEEEEEENGDISKEELDEENEAKEPAGSIVLSGEEGEDGENDEDPEQKARKSKYRRGGRKKTTKPTIGTIPELGTKKKQKEPRNPALAIIASIKNNGMRKFKNFMPMKGVLKHIYTLYNDRSKDNAIEKDEEFPKFVYTWFLNNFGFKKLAEQKFIIFVLSVKKYIYIVRINLFARFLGLLDGSSNYNLDEFGKYLEAMDYISKVNMGSPIQNVDTDSKHYVAFLKGADYIKYFAETKMSFEEYTEFRKGIEAIKEADPRGINRNGIIDFDLLMTKVLAKYRIICNRTKQNVVNAFKAADLDGNKTCSMKEFILLYKNIEQEKYDYWFAETVFNEHADVKIDGEMNLTFDKFTVVCVEYTLFSDAQQDRFLEIQNSDDLANEMKQLKDLWDHNYTNVNENLDLLTKIPAEEVKYWRNIIDVIGTRVAAIDDYASSEVKPLLIAYKILKVEIERLKEEDMEIDLYGVKKPKLERFDPSLNPLNHQFNAKDLFKQNMKEKNKAPNNRGRHSKKNEFSEDDLISQKKNSMMDKNKEKTN